MPVATVVDLDAYAPVVGPEHEEPEAPAGRDAVEQGVGGQFAHAEQDVVAAHAGVPLVQYGGGEVPGCGDGSALAAVEALAVRGESGFGFHPPTVTQRH